MNKPKRKSVSDYRLVWFQHTQKSAGTYVFGRAQANGEKFWPNHHIGNPLDEKGQIIPLWKKSDEELLQFIDECEEQGVTFVGAEWGSPNYELLANDPRVVLLTTMRNPISRFNSHYNFAYYGTWVKVNNLEDFTNLGLMHHTTQYYVRMYSRNTDVSSIVTEDDLKKARDNLELFDYVIIVEDNMDALNELGWTKDCPRLNSTFGNKGRFLHMLIKLKWIRLFEYIRKVKHKPLEGLEIDEMFKDDMELYESLR